MKKFIQITILFLLFCIVPSCAPKKDAIPPEHILAAGLFYLSSLDNVDKVDNVPIVYNVIVNISGLTSSGLELRLNGGVSATVPINTT
ncbi:MAG: hypothetical protein OEZ34_14575, partial [Spirochaetia bacterium]|nr:hypothetical protein [Spirochaetia bacterium]